MKQYNLAQKRIRFLFSGDDSSIHTQTLYTHNFPPLKQIFFSGLCIYMSKCSSPSPLNAIDWTEREKLEREREKKIPSPDSLVCAPLELVLTSLTALPVFLLLILKFKNYFISIHSIVFL